MLRELGRVLVNPFYECGSAYVCFAPKATELLRGNEMTRRANSRRQDIGREERLQQDGKRESMGLRLIQLARRATSLLELIS